MGMMGSLPFMPIPRARIRALKWKPLAGWDDASIALALADHVFRELSYSWCLRYAVANTNKGTG